MLSFLSENRAPVLAVLLLFSFLLLLSAQVRFPTSASTLETALLTLFSPVARGGSAVVRAVSGLWSGYVDLRGLREENVDLRREVAALRLERQLLQESARENRRLREVLALKASLPLASVPAHVISLDLAGPFRVAVLDRGSRHGIAADDGVITPDGVVGRVISVSGGLAKVQLLIDSSSGAAAVVERTRVQGMVVGRGVNTLEMNYVSRLSEVAPEDWVDTSALAGIYPPGYRIGRVRAVGDGEGLQRRVLIETAVDFRTLEEVLVLTGRETEGTSQGTATAEMLGGEGS
jgi:rod shape-determining protein MreC